MPPAAPGWFLRAHAGASRICSQGLLTVLGPPFRDPAPRRHRALSVGSARAGLVFDIVDLERETQAAASWRWSLP
jgi:hypothetical protein